VWKDQQFPSNLVHSERRPTEYPIYEDCKDQDFVDQDLADLSQYGLYLVVVNALWWATIRDVDTWQLIFLPLALLFIFDDYIIISEYTRALQGYTLRWHVWRINGLNAIIVVLLIMPILETFTWRGRVLNGTMLVLFLVWLYLPLVEKAFSKVGIGRNGTKWLATFLTMLPLLLIVWFIGHILLGWF
jgi:hypothetical protein